MLASTGCGVNIYNCFGKKVGFRVVIGNSSKLKAMTCLTCRKTNEPNRFGRFLENFHFQKIFLAKNVLFRPRELTNLSE